MLLPIVSLIAILSGMIALDANDLQKIETLRKLSDLSQPKATITLLLSFLAISACYLVLFVAYVKKPNIGHYDLINPPGFLKDKKTGKYYCQKCLLINHVASELSAVVTKDELICHCCDKTYNISADLITDSCLSKAYDEAIKEIHLKDTDG